MLNPERWDQAEWNILCRRANVYRALTPFYECNALLDYPMPKDHCVVWRWAGVKRTTPAATAAANHPIFTCAVELEGLMRLALWQGGILFVSSSTVFYNYNLTGRILQQISAGIYANQLLRLFAIEKHMLTRIKDVGTNQPLLTAAIRTMVAQLLKVQVPNPFLGIRNWACIQTVPPQEPHSFLARRWPGTPPLQHEVLSFGRWFPVFPLEWGLTGRGPNVNFTAECTLISRVEDQCAWRGEQGSGDYALRVSGARPFRQVAYGPLAINTIWQLLPAFQEFAPPMQRTAPCIRRGTLAMVPAIAYPANTVEVNNDLNIIVPCTLPTYDWVNHQIYVPTLLAAQVGHQNLAMLSRLNGPQTYCGFTWNPIAPLDLVEFDPDDGDDDVLDAFAAMAVGAPAAARNDNNPPPEPPAPHQPPAVPQNAQAVAPPPQANPLPLGDVLVNPPGQVQGAGAPPAPGGAP